MLLFFKYILTNWIQTKLYNRKFQLIMLMAKIKEQILICIFLHNFNKSLTY